MAKKSRKVPAPVTGGVAKVPVIMQMEALECGAACLTIVMAFYQKWVPLEQVRVDCGVSRDGSKAKNVLLAARSYGFKATGYRMETEAIRSQGVFPCIIHWNFNHFVVLNGFRGNKASLNDPARGTVWVSMDEFDEAFTGVCLQIVPGEDFVPGGKPKSTLEFARKRLRGAGAAVAFVILTTIIASIFDLINPAMTRIFYERLLTGVNPDWLQPFILVMIGLCVTQLIVEWARIIYSLKINGKLAVIGSSSFFWKVLCMPMEFFTQRLTGDILQRQETNETIASTLVQTMAPLGLNMIMTVLYLVVMLRYSALLTLIGVLTVVIDLVMARYMSNKRINTTRSS